MKKLTGFQPLDDDSWDYACHECGSIHCGCADRAARQRYPEVHRSTVFDCKLCGKDLGREFGRGTHYNCNLAVKHSLDALGQGLRDAGMLQHAWELGAGWSDAMHRLIRGEFFTPDWNPNVRYDHDAGDEDV